MMNQQRPPNAGSHDAEQEACPILSAIEQGKEDVFIATYCRPWPRLGPT